MSDDGEGAEESEEGKSKAEGGQANKTGNARRVLLDRGGGPLQQLSRQCARWV